MRKPVRGALQGCPSKGLAASPPAPNTAALFSSESISRGLGCVSTGDEWEGRGRLGGGAVRFAQLPSRLHNLLYNSSTSTDHISGSDELIILHTVTNGRVQVPYLLSYIFAKFVYLWMMLHNLHSCMFVLFKPRWSWWGSCVHSEVHSAAVASNRVDLLQLLHHLVVLVISHYSLFISHSIPEGNTVLFTFYF